MSTTSKGPTLLFFRTIPDNLAENPPLASSLQTLETCFLLIALKRYPTALVTCASAIEGAIKAHLRIPVEDEITFSGLLGRVGTKKGNLAISVNPALADFRSSRNRIVHYGFSPEDDSQCAALLLRVGLPYLGKCYEELFNIVLTSEDEERIALRLDLAEQLRAAREVYWKARELRGLDLTYCFQSFGHFIRFILKDNFTSTAEMASLEEAYSGGAQFEHEERGRVAVEKEFGLVSWNFRCPVCDGLETFVAELREARLADREVTFVRGHCVRCGLAVRENSPYLIDCLLKEQLKTQRDYILDDCGLGGTGKPREGRGRFKPPNRSPE